jgi:hypothetical protein
LVDSTEVGLLHYAIIDGHWQPTLYESTDDQLQLPDLGLTLALREVYLDVWPEKSVGRELPFSARTGPHRGRGQVSHSTPQHDERTRALPLASVQNAIGYPLLGCL